MKIGEDFLEVDTGGPVTGFNDVRDTEEFLKLNPYRLIPVMKHGDVVLYESQAICQYIANVLGGPMSAQNEGERARISMYGLSSISNFEPNLLPMVFGQGGKEGRVQFTKKLQPLLNALNTELEGRDYLIGEGRGRFTVADVMMASVKKPDDDNNAISSNETFPEVDTAVKEEEKVNGFSKEEEIQINVVDKEKEFKVDGEENKKHTP
eukprot:g1599.t1